MRQLRASAHSVQASFLAVLATGALVTGAAGCGGQDKGSETSNAAATSLQEAMTDASRNIDSVRGTRDSLSKLYSVLKPSIAQTGDVIVQLTPEAASQGVDAKLLAAAKQQRTFLQYAADAANSRSWSVGKTDLARAKQASRRAVDYYASAAREAGDLAGLLPPSTAFNLGTLTLAVEKVTKGGPKGRTTPGTLGPDPGNCGDGISVNGVTSCPFARNVAAQYRSRGGGYMVLYDVYSPSTGRFYDMTCAGGVCRGGNNAEVVIR